ncbi:hypothetical protein [Streptomyces sp. YIM S03343]
MSKLALRITTGLLAAAAFVGVLGAEITATTNALGGTAGMTLAAPAHSSFVVSPADDQWG